MERFAKLFSSLLVFVGSEEAHSVALALASVRRSNCTCGFLACSFHEDSFFRDAIEGINRTRFTKPYSP
jgi:hypothetical protein